MSARSVVPCPRCGLPAVFAPENLWRPFCSERCQQIDLGNWATERYRLPENSKVADDEPSGAT